MSMSDWASPILVVPKKEEHAETGNNTSDSKDSMFNLWLYIDYRKLNRQIQTTHQIKANGSLGKVILNYSLPMIDSILVQFNGCKFFSMIDLRSGYYHICLTKEAAEETAFVRDKGKWICHSLPFGINIGPSAFSYVLDKVLAQCTEFVLNYLDDIMIFSKTWQDHLNHLEEVFKHLWDVDFKIKCSKCKFFKPQVNYLNFLVGTQGMQLLPGKVTTMDALEPPKDIDELRQFFGLVGYYRKFIPFLMDVTVCHITMLRKGRVFKWTEQCGNTFKLLKSDLRKKQTCIFFCIFWLLYYFFVLFVFFNFEYRINKVG